MTEAKGELSRTSKSGGERLFRGVRTTQNITSAGRLDPDIQRPPRPTQLVLDPDDHIEHNVTPQLRRRLRQPGLAKVKEALDAATYSRAGKSNPHERTSR